MQPTTKSAKVGVDVIKPGQQAKVLVAQPGLNQNGLKAWADKDNTVPGQAADPLTAAKAGLMRAIPLNTEQNGQQHLGADLYRFDQQVHKSHDQLAREFSVKASMVVDMPFDVQRGFRIKTLALLSIQLVCTFVLMCIVEFSPIRLSTHFTGMSYLIVFGCTAFLMVLLNSVRHKHPWNYVVLFILTGFLSCLFGAGTIFFQGYSNFQMIGYATLGTCFTSILSSRKVPNTDPNVQSQWKMMSMGKAGSIAWAGVCIFAIVFWALFQVSSFAFVIASLFWSMMLHAWFCYDAARLMERMRPDEYMLSVVYFYADICGLISVCITCCLCFATGASK